MKKILLNLLAFFFFLKTFGSEKTEYSIAFVHIGSSIPKYTITAIRQARLFNPSCEIYLVAGEKYLRSLNKDCDFSGVNPIFVPIESLTLHRDHIKFRVCSKLDQKYREGFWQYTTERFFFLKALIMDLGLENVFHLENDVMLYTNLRQHLEIFQNAYQGIAATFDNETRVIPGFLYIPGAKSISKLTKFLAKRSFKGENDMTSLARFRSVEKSKFIDNLPIIFPAYTTKYPLLSLEGDCTEEPNLFYKNFDKFQSIFDAAAIGQYMGGIDPRNGDFRKGFVNRSCLFNPSYLLFEWQLDEMGRKVPFALFEGQKIKINNLHIHSKNLEAFFSENL